VEAETAVAGRCRKEAPSRQAVAGKCRNAGAAVVVPSPSSR